eukprot:GEMP01048688.1.p1 GENE.GEMP01048688.1~~GEMP01048688.1.p1  ORF type:complete len:315 (+),score=72.01 GEMP01048688.1:20-964(+)
MVSKLRERMGVSFVVRWINFLGVWPEPLTDKSIFEELRSGVLLCQIVRTVLPSATQHMPTGTKTLTKAPCLANLEEALSVILRQGGARMSIVASSEDFYNANIHQVSQFLPEMFRLMMTKELMHVAPAMLSAFDDDLRPFERDVGSQSLALADAYGDGVRLMLILHKRDKVGVKELAQLYGNPQNARQKMDNCIRLTNILEKHHVPVLLDALSWSQPVPSGALICQLYVIQEHLKQEARVGRRYTELKGEAMARFVFRDGVPLMPVSAAFDGGPLPSQVVQRLSSEAGFSDCLKERHLLYSEDVRRHFQVVNGF